MGGARNQKRTAAYVNLCQTIYGGLHCVFFFFNDTATPEIYTLSLHDALPISSGGRRGRLGATRGSWTLHRREPELAVVVGEDQVLVPGDLDQLAVKVGGDGQLAPAPLGEDREAHRARAAEVEELVQRRADGAAGVQCVVHEDDLAPVDRERDLATP